MTLNLEATFERSVAFSTSDMLRPVVSCRPLCELMLLSGTKDPNTDTKHNANTVSSVLMVIPFPVAT